MCTAGLQRPDRRPDNANIPNKILDRMPENILDKIP
jgi:hypothetical protein